MQFRILDLGAHDGFVTNFIARQARNSGVDVHVDGVEANPDAVRIFNERMQRDGLSGECKQGLAEDAPHLFEPESYDAVVAFEIIEHAPIVEKLLCAAEWMCKKDGIASVYISTPNGTFGEGNNPHHLRTWNITTLFELLRKRGPVQDVLPGHDGVSVVRYVPDPNVTDDAEVAIYTGPGWETWAPSDIETKGLGGSETAAVRLAASLSGYGCRVTVYGEVTNGAAGQVSYRHHSTFDPSEPRDLVICSRIPELADRWINARATLLWMHDTDCGDRLTPERAARFTRIMVLSIWHYNHVLKAYPFLSEKQLYMTRNGIEPSYFTEGEVERNPHRAIYTSSPDRGLDFLLAIWPEVREKVPDAELVFAYASVYHAVAKANPAIAAFRRKIEALADQPGVVDLGSLTQPGVAREMRASGVWLAPSFSTPAGVPFNETFCIGAVEAAAAGCYRVMASWGALSERTESGGDWLDDLDRGRWVGIIARRMNASYEPADSPRTALKMTWDEVAADMLSASADSPG